MTTPADTDATTDTDPITRNGDGPAQPPDPPEPPPAADDTATMSTQLVKYTPEHRALIVANIGEGNLSDGEVDLVMYQAERLGLDVLSGQMHAWKTDGKLVMMTSIHGLRAVARRTGKYGGRRGPQFLTHDSEWVDVWVAELYPEGKRLPLAARCWVRNTDDLEWTIGVAAWSEFAQYTDVWEGPRGQRRKVGRKLRALWNPDGGKPSVMIGKCAESQALRAAFPADLTGVYTDDEINTADALLDDQGDPLGRPGAGSSEIQAIVDQLAALPIDAREKIESYWANHYVPAYLDGATVGDIGTIADGGLERWHPTSEHVQRIGELIKRAADATAAQPTSSESPAADGPPSSAAGAGAPDPVAPNAPEPGDPLPRLDLYLLAFDQPEAILLAALDDIGAGTMAEIAERAGVNLTASVKTTIAGLFEANMIRLDPDAGPGMRGPYRVYQVNYPTTDARIDAASPTESEQP